MVEDVDLVPANKVEPRAVRQKIETSLGQFGTSFTGQHGIENSFDFMQVNSLVQKLAGESERIPVEQAMG